MRTLFFTIMVFLCLSTVASAELSVEDLEKIRQIVNEAEVRLEKRITETEVRLEKHFADRFTDQSKRLDFHATLIITLIGTLIAFVGVPLVLIAYQQNRRIQQDDTIKAQATEIQALREKFESLEKLLS
ncbi:hypothetical protein J4G08_01350 [Candidatus Poribacteria bacterium]|nr:hypothetical protein [Candidatus Poribacteria bacterium]